MDLYIRVIDDKFVTGIYHKVDDFNFEVINYPFPDSNIHSSLGYTNFYSQLIRFHRLCNNKSDFLFRAELIFQKLINRGYKFNLLRKFLWDLSINIQWKLNMESRGMTVCSFKCSILIITLYVSSTMMMLTRLWHHVLWKLKTLSSSPFTTRINLSPPFPQIANTHTKWGDATPFPTGLWRESGGKQLWGIFFRQPTTHY